MTTVEIDVSLSPEYPVFIRLPEPLNGAQPAGRQYINSTYEEGKVYLNLEVHKDVRIPKDYVTTAIFPTKSLTVNLRIRLVKSGGDSQIEIAKAPIDPAVAALAEEMCESERQELQAERDRIRRQVQRTANARILRAVVIGDIRSQEVDVNPARGDHIVARVSDVISFGKARILVVRLKNRDDPITLGPVTLERAAGGQLEPLKKRVRCGQLRLGYNDRTRCAVEVAGVNSGDVLKLTFTDRAGQKTVHLEPVRVP